MRVSAACKKVKRYRSSIYTMVHHHFLLYYYCLLASLFVCCYWSWCRLKSKQKSSTRARGVSRPPPRPPTQSTIMAWLRYTT